MGIRLSNDNAIAFRGTHGRNMGKNSILILCELLLHSVRTFEAVLYCNQLSVDYGLHPLKLRILSTIKCMRVYFLECKKYDIFFISQLQKARAVN